MMNESRRKNSKKRAALLEVLRSTREHPTAESLYLALKPAYPELSLGTVYRNLGLLVQAGQIRKLEMADAPARYDRERRPHPHLICQRCGRVEDLVMPEALLAPLEAGLPGPITGYELKLYHICPACRGARKDGAR